MPLPLVQSGIIPLFGWRRVEDPPRLWVRRSGLQGDEDEDDDDNAAGRSGTFDTVWMTRAVEAGGKMRDGVQAIVAGMDAAVTA